MDVTGELLAGCRILSGERLTDAFGHLSARDANGAILMTPRIGPGLVRRADDVLRTDAGGRVLAGDESLVPGEAALHHAVLRERPDVVSVCRFHGPACLAWSTLGEPLRPIIGPALFFGTEVPVHDTARTITTPELGAAVAATLGNGRAVLMRGFGAVTVGTSVAEAVVGATVLERAAAAVLAARHAGTPIEYGAEQAAAFAANDKVIAEQVLRAWTYLQERWPEGGTL